MDLQGNLNLERTPSRRWVSIVAVVVPVVAFVSLGAWFVRAYVMPPTITIPNPTVLAAAPPEMPQPEPPAATPAPAAAPASSAPAAETTATSLTLPMFATLAAAPPALDSAPAAYADPARDNVPATMAEAAIVEGGEPIAGPIPVPRRKPQMSAALAGGAVPLPRPRPAEDTPPPDLPAIDRHAVE